MKSAPLAAGALAIAITFGTGGYFLGKSRPAPPPTEAAAAVSGEQRTPPVSRRPQTASVDTVELRAKLDAEKNPLKRFDLALQHLEAWIAKNPKEALDWLATQEPSGRRDDVIREALAQFAEQDAGAAADWAMANLTGAELNNALILIAEGWAEQDGGTAAAWFLGRPATDERDAALESLFFTWATNNPVAAMDYLKQNPGVVKLDPALLRAALAGWAKSEPEAAVAASLALSQANGDAAQFANTLANWGTMDLDASGKWLLANVPAGAQRDAALQQIASIYASQSPEAGIAWLGNLKGVERDTAAGVLAANWSRRAPVQAAQWLGSQPSANLAPQAIMAVARNYLIKDINGFKAWLAALPDGPVKQHASEVGAVSEDDD
jgi:hypothetical protein